MLLFTTRGWFVPHPPPQTYHLLFSFLSGRGYTRCICLYLYVLQIWHGPDWVVWHVDLKEGVELVVAATQCGSDGIDAVAPVQGVWVVQPEWPRGRLILCTAEKAEGECQFVYNGEKTGRHFTLSINTPFTISLLSILRCMVRMTGGTVPLPRRSKPRPSQRQK